MVIRKNIDNEFEIREIILKGKKYWVLNDLAKALLIKSPRSIFKRYKQTLTIPKYKIDTDGGVQSVNIVDIDLFLFILSGTRKRSESYKELIIKQLGLDLEQYYKIKEEGVII